MVNRFLNGAVFATSLFASVVAAIVVIITCAAIPATVARFSEEPEDSYALFLVLSVFVPVLATSILFAVTQNFCVPSLRIITVIIGGITTIWLASLAIWMFAVLESFSREVQVLALLLMYLISSLSFFLSGTPYRQTMRSEVGDVRGRKWFSP